MPSKLQIKAQKRNSAKGRITGLRNNIRGMLSDKSTPLTQNERFKLSVAETEFDIILKDWNKHWEQLKKDE